MTSRGAGEPASAHALRVGGVVPFTATDFPGKLAAVVFLQGCPWRCGYCHNPHLCTARGATEREWGRILGWLEGRCALLDAVVFSGGEPTAQPALSEAVRAVRGLGFATGLHTAGAYPHRLAEVLPELDWVGFDLKAPCDDYPNVTNVPGSGAPAYASLDCVLASGVSCEIRTTVHPSLTSRAALEAMAGELAARGVTEWVLQPFRPTGCTSEALVAAAPGGARIDPVVVSYLAARVPGVVVR